MSNMGMSCPSSSARATSMGGLFKNYEGFVSMFKRHSSKTATFRYFLIWYTQPRNLSFPMNRQPFLFSTTLVIVQVFSSLTFSRQPEYGHIAHATFVILHIASFYHLCVCSWPSLPTKMADFRVKWCVVMPHNTSICFHFSVTIV